MFIPAENRSHQPFLAVMADFIATDRSVITVVATNSFLLLHAPDLAKD